MRCPSFSAYPLSGNCRRTQYFSHVLFSRRLSAWLTYQKVGPPSLKHGCQTTPLNLEGDGGCMGTILTSSMLGFSSSQCEFMADDSESEWVFIFLFSYDTPHCLCSRKHDIAVIARNEFAASGLRSQLDFEGIPGTPPLERYHFLPCNIPGPGCPAPWHDKQMEN